MEHCYQTHFEVITHRLNLKRKYAVVAGQRGRERSGMRGEQIEGRAEMRGAVKEEERGLQYLLLNKHVLLDKPPIQ